MTVYGIVELVRIVGREDGALPERVMRPERRDAILFRDREQAKEYGEKWFTGDDWDIEAFDLDVP